MKTGNTLFALLFFITTRGGNMTRNTGVKFAGIYNMGITPRCNALVRTYLIEASWVVLRKDVSMQKYYRSHVGKNPKSVIVNIAHKLCCRILSVIKQERPYVLNHRTNIETIKML